MSIFEEDIDQVIQHINGFSNEFNGKNYFVTGGTGFFGIWILYSFATLIRRYELNSTLTVLSREPDHFLNAHPLIAGCTNISFHRGNILDFDFPSGNFHAAIHGAADVHGDHKNSIQTSFVGTQRILEFCRLKNISKYLLVSSGAVYGEPPVDSAFIAETYSGAPRLDLASSAYGEGKRLSEWLSHEAARYTSLEVKIARCFAFVGPYLPLNSQFAIGNFMADAVLKKPISILGDGCPTRSYLYAADLAIWLWTILFRGGKGETYNVGSNVEISIAELASKVAKYGGTIVNTPEVKKDNRTLTPASRYIPSISKAEALGLKILTPLDSAICRSLDHFRSQRELI